MDIAKDISGEDHYIGPARRYENDGDSQLWGNVRFNSNSQLWGNVRFNNDLLLDPNAFSIKWVEHE